MRKTAVQKFQSENGKKGHKAWMSKYSLSKRKKWARAGAKARWAKLSTMGDN